MATWVNLDVIPQLGRPAEVEQTISEATALRDRARQAQEQSAARQQELEQAERADVEAAAERARAGAALGTTPAAVKKARDQLESAKREAAALALAADGAAVDLVEVMRAQGDAWLAQLDVEAEQARECGRQAIAALEAAARELGTAASASAWLHSGLSDGRFDRQPGATVTAAAAPSSARRTANSEPLRVDELIGYARELIDPPAAPRRAVVHVPPAAA